MDSSPEPAMKTNSVAVAVALWCFITEVGGMEVVEMILSIVIVTVTLTEVVGAGCDVGIVIADSSVGTQ